VVRRTPSKVAAYVAMMLDVAEEAHVDLWALELCRRELVRAEAAYDELAGLGSPARGRLDELEKSMALGVSVLAAGFQRMARVVDGPVEHGRP
jgi:hypothetical protein